MTRKEFTIKNNEKEIKLAVRMPQIDDREEADKIYASRVASLVRDNPTRRLLLRSQLDNFLRETGVWTEKDEEAIEKIYLEIEEMLSRLRKGGIKLSEGRQLSLGMMDKRREIKNVMSKRQIFDDTTIEAMAENERNDYLIYGCTVHADSGLHYWDSFEDMKNDKLSDAYRRASVLTIELIYNYNPEVEKRLPENKWLLKHGFIDEDLNYVDRKTKEKVDRDGRPVKEIEAEMKKRLDSLDGEVTEEAPFIDDETGQPVQ